MGWMRSSSPSHSLFQWMPQMPKKKSHLALFIFFILKTECCFSGGRKEDRTVKERPHGVGRKDKQVFTRFKGVSCNLSLIKLLINTRVALESLSTLPHLHKIKGTRFPCHCLPIERLPFPSMGWPWPVGANLRSVYQRSAEAFSCSAPAGKAADKPAPSFERLIMLKWSQRDYAGKSWRKKKIKNQKKKQQSMLRYFLQACTWL